MHNIISDSDYAERIQEMEAKLVALRLSRRVLMDMLKKEQEEKNATIARLQAENKKLRIANHNYAKKIWQNHLACADHHIGKEK